MLKNDINLFCGDCLEGLKALSSNSVDLVLCDPPYGITRAEWDKALDFDKLWAELYRIAKPTAAFIFFGSGKFTFKLIGSNFEDFRYRYIWVKNVATGFLNANRQPLKIFEDICVFYRSMPVYNPQKTQGKPYIRKPKGRSRGGDLYGNFSDFQHGSPLGQRFPTDVLYYPIVPINSDERIHKTQKPVALLEQLIRTYTHEGDVVLDPCMGSGSTGVAALRSGRSFVGMEIDESFFNTAKQRLESLK